MHLLSRKTPHSQGFGERGSLNQRDCARSLRLELLSLALLAMLWGSAAGAQEEAGDAVEKVNSRSAKSATSWTPERFLKARPLPIPEASLDSPSEIEEPRPESEVGAEREGWPSRPPRLYVKPDLDNYLFDPRDLPPDPLASELEEGPDQKARGTQNLDFTSSRLVPLSSDLYYPYRAVGKIFFSSSDGDFVCSGAMVSRRVMVTAGHCVHDGEGNWFDDFVFVPAYRDGVAPYGVWDWEYVVVTGAWANGGGDVPNLGDFAMMVLRDLRGDRAGDVVGWLGWQTGRLKTNHVTMLGYPGNLDSGRKMHQVNAGRHKNGGRSTVLYGSDMGGGSSGGPWVQNFGVRVSGQTGGRRSEINRVIGITSYGFRSTASRVQGSSQPQSSFSNLFRRACEQAAGNCS